MKLLSCLCFTGHLALPTDSIWAITTAHAHAHAHAHTHTFNGPLSRTTRVSRYQKGKTNLDYTEAKDSEWQWHQLGHMQVCTSLQTDNHASTTPVNFLQAGCPSGRPTNSVKALKAKGNYDCVNDKTEVQDKITNAQTLLMGTFHTELANKLLLNYTVKTASETHSVLRQVEKLQLSCCVPHKETKNWNSLQKALLTAHNESMEFLLVGCRKPSW